MVSMPQASQDPLLISAGTIEAYPELFKDTSISRVLTVGTIRSTTVMIALHELEFPFISTTVNVTSTFSPTSSQLKSYLSRYKVSIPQLSVDPTFTSCGRIDRKSTRL